MGLTWDWSAVDWPQVVATVGIAAAVFGLWIRFGFDKEIARQAALLARGTNLHQIQVKHLCQLYGSLRDATGDSQHVTAGVRWSDDPPEEQIAKNFRESLARAYREYTECYLLLPKSVADQIEGFFRRMGEFRIQLGAVESIPAGLDHAKAFTAAQMMAAEQIPKLLDAIAVSGRRLIGSDREA